MKLLKFVCSSAACLLGASGYCYFSGAPWFFSNIVMPSTKWMDPERAHRVAVYLASKNFVPKDRFKDDVVLVRSALMLHHIILRRMLPPIPNWLTGFYLLVLQFKKGGPGVQGHHRQTRVDKAERTMKSIPAGTRPPSSCGFHLHNSHHDLPTLSNQL